MKKIQDSLLPLLLLAGTGMTVVSLPALANVEAECRQESEEYGIPPEQQEDYVTGCVLSRGGNYPQEPAVQDDAMQGDTGVDAEAGADGNYSADPGVNGSNLPE